MAALKTKVLLVILLAASVASAQGLRITEGPRFSVYKATTLSSASEAVTIQQPASGGRTVNFDTALLYCSVACSVELERDGTAATGTALTPVVLTFGTATADAFHTSDVGNGSTVTEYNVSAGETLGIDLRGIRMTGNGTGQNLTFRTNTISGDVRITVVWREQ